MPPAELTGPRAPAVQGATPGCLGTARCRSSLAWLGPIYRACQLVGKSGSRRHAGFLHPYCCPATPAPVLPSAAHWRLGILFHLAHQVECIFLLAWLAVGHHLRRGVQGGVATLSSGYAQQ